ncbi:MAG: hypothetical protein GC185_08545 [Alphaproteobacteria bacterium]|nr:hypothetical protein [Alphaproteobacteria bacterium]
MKNAHDTELKRPAVMVYIGDDDPTRGDSHGFKGIGRALARKLGASFHYLEDKTLLSLYPQFQTAAGGLARYIDEHGKPDVLFSRASSRDNPVLSTLRDTLKISAINESFALQMMGSAALVAHHLTPDLLEEEGRAFRAAHPVQKDETLVAVLLAQASQLNAFADKLVSKCAAQGKTAIFVCACWRTREEEFDKLTARLEQMIAARGLGAQLRVKTYHPARDGDAHNPYAGLLDAADHVVLAGASHSMMSEALAAGKAVITYSAGPADPGLKEKGLTLNFNDCAADKRFEAGRVAPIDVTAEIAERIAQKIRPGLEARYQYLNNLQNFS